MLEFDFNESNEGVWFPYQQSKVDPNDNENIIWEDPIEGAEFKIRSIDPYIREKIIKEDKTRAVKFVVNEKTKAMERLSYIPEKTFEEQIKSTQDMYIWAIISWKGVGSKGNLLEVNDDNKIKLANNSEFCRFFNRCQDLLKKQSSFYKEESEKN